MLSVTVTVKVVAGIDTVGVPVIAPVLRLNVNPAGNGLFIPYVNGALPPDPIIGVNVLATTPLVNAVAATDRVATSPAAPALIVSAKLWLAV